MSIFDLHRVKALRVKEEFMDEVGRCNKNGFHEHSAPSKYMSEVCAHTALYDPNKKGVATRIDDFRT